MLHHHRVLLFLGSGILLLAACQHEPDGAAVDGQLFREATADGFTYYVGTPGITAPDGASAHGPFRVRFNAIAQAALDSTGKLPPGSSFPEGAMIVKDIYEGSDLVLYAIMKKDPTSPLAGSGWLWAELGTDGAVDFSAGKMGDGCIGCHSEGLQRDLVRVFDLH